MTATNEKGNTFLRSELGCGEFFGEISLLTGEPRSATVKAMEYSELLVMSSEDVRGGIS